MVQRNGVEPLAERVAALEIETVCLFIRREGLVKSSRIVQRPA